MSHSQKRTTSLRREPLDQDNSSPTKRSRIDTPSTSTDTVNKTDHYNMDHSFRGYGVIFYQQNYKRCITKSTHCPCSNIEVERISNTLQNLDFEVTTYRDLSLCEIKREIKILAEETDHSSADCIVVVMLTHGNNNSSLCTRTHNLPVQDLWTQFCASKCPSLAGKPKIFFIE
ncbi:hypothetical protein L9F63_011046, partial [Diploptera punctata]